MTSIIFVIGGLSMICGSSRGERRLTERPGKAKGKQRALACGIDAVCQKLNVSWAVGPHQS